MKITDARWTPQIDMLQILCHCGIAFEHQADRNRVRCPGGHVRQVHDLRLHWAGHGPEP